jgi:demethylmenaquinone methyltransferase/2-methoxy-6-polyprenyl-1,4-benzoquinol methylase
MLSKSQVLKLYDKRAKNYDRLSRFYDWLEGSEKFPSYTKRAIDLLNLSAGDTVLEIGCGTGLNFSLMQAKLGPGGRLIGVDLSGNMLAKAKNRVEKEGWSNVELVQSDAAAFKFPSGLKGIFSCLAITLIPEYRDVIKRGADALAPGGRFVIMDLKAPSHWPRWRLCLAAWMNRPFGVRLDMADRHPWEAIEEHLAKVSFVELHDGLVYISCGEKLP